MSADTPRADARDAMADRAAYSAGARDFGTAAGHNPHTCTPHECSVCRAIAEAAAKLYPLPEEAREFHSPLDGVRYRVVGGYLESWLELNHRWWRHPGDTPEALRAHYRGLADLFDRPTMPAPEEP